MIFLESYVTFSKNILLSEFRTSIKVQSNRAMFNNHHASYLILYNFCQKCRFLIAPNSYCDVNTSMTRLSDYISEHVFGKSVCEKILPHIHSMSLSIHYGYSICTQYNNVVLYSLSRKPVLL